MADEITVQAPVPPTGDLVAPVVDVTQRVTRVEEQQAQHAERLARDIAELEERVRSASASQVGTLEERINALSAKLEALSQPPVQQIEEIPESTEDAIEMTTPEIEEAPEPPEKRRKGIHGRKREKRRNKRTA